MAKRKNTDSARAYYRYDSIGNLIEKKKNTPLRKKQLLIFLAHHQILYDSATNNLVKITDPAGKITEYIYDSAHKYAYIKRRRKSNSPKKAAGITAHLFRSSPTTTGAGDLPKDQPGNQ